MRRPHRAGLYTLIATTTLLAAVAGCEAAPQQTDTQFSITFPDSVHSGPVTGRVFVMISRDSAPEPRFLAGSYAVSVPFFGTDVDALQPGRRVMIDARAPGYPIESLRDLPPGDYYVQALLNEYTQFRRADGHVIWAHMDQWEGQQMARSPGNMYSDVHRVRLNPARGFGVALSLTHTIPAVEPPADTKWVKRVRIRSKLLSDFWGHDMQIGATVLLPDGYDSHPDVRYPVVYDQGHFGLGAPYGFSPDSTPVAAPVRSRLQDLNRETGHQFFESWTSPAFPRMIVVTFQHPTPYYDDSYAVNSANNGPYADALLTELVPYLEQHFRVIAQPWARVLTGGSTGGWESLALQVLHPKFFNGTWTLYPDPVDFRHNQLVDIYADTNAFILSRDSGTFMSPPTPWQHPERPVMRTPDGQPFRSMREMSRLEAVLGSHARSGQQFAAWDAAYGPVGSDGYPAELWDKHTGHIDPNVAEYWRSRGYDLRAYLADNWSTIGPDLVDKIHVDVGDMDHFYLNLAVYDLQAFLDSTAAPPANATFHYGRPEKGHGWQHASTADLLREMADFITKHASAGADTKGWRY